MIVCSKTQYLPTILNVSTLQKEDNFYYLDRDMYDKTVILEDRFDKEYIDKMIGKDINNDVAEWFHENAPRPLNMLAPFLNLVEEEIEPDMELCCGILHVIFSTGMDPKRFIQSPTEVRKSISFSLSIKNEYKSSWKACMISFLPISDLDSMIDAKNILNRAVPPEMQVVYPMIYPSFGNMNPNYTGTGSLEMKEFQKSNDYSASEFTESDLGEDEIIFEDDFDFGQLNLSKEDMNIDLSDLGKDDKKEEALQDNNIKEDTIAADKELSRLSQLVDD